MELVLKQALVYEGGQFKTKDFAVNTDQPSLTQGGTISDFSRFLRCACAFA